MIVTSPPDFVPLLISAPRARRMLDIGQTKFWAMVKAGKIKMADTGGRRMVVFASLNALIDDVDPLSQP